MLTLESKITNALQLFIMYMYFISYGVFDRIFTDVY